MRQAGIIPTRADAERFADYLLSLGITSKVEPAGAEWAIWIHDENQIPRSKQELEEFQRTPEDQRYAAATAAAEQVRRETAEKKRQRERNYHDMREEWANPWHRRPVTLVMILICVALAVGLAGQFKEYLYFSWPDIQAGQVWRLVTPVFLHAPLAGAPWHLIFNMFMLYDLGTIVERQLRSFRFVLFVLAVAIASNYVQFIARGPNFVGMSGVVYGLFGYAWVRGRLDPTSGLYLRPSVPVIMIGWFFLCAAGLVGNVANWAHGGGLAAGALLGYLSHLAHSFRRNP
jgi:GlpG protein